MLVLVTGAILAPGRRTVAAALSGVGLREASTFTTFHRVLDRGRWSGLAGGRRLLGLPVQAFVPSGPVVVSIDETIERRWGPKIEARGIDRDPMRSSKGHFVEISGLRWISVMLLTPGPWPSGSGPCRSPPRWRPPSSTPRLGGDATRGCRTGDVSCC